MRTFIASLVMSVLMALAAISCGSGEGTDVVDSGTYEGTIKKVVPAKVEIYVETTDGQLLELYFIDETELLLDGGAASFDVLSVGDKVEVTLEKVGKRLEPLVVKVLESAE